MQEDEIDPRFSKSFIDAQRISAKRIGFTVTRACPLRCAHCSASAAPELANSTFTSDFAKHVTNQMHALRDIGIKFIDFTGGEPVLARTFLQKVSRAAVEAGISCGIVTAAHWAKSQTSAEALIAQFPDIKNWDISTDVYHTEFVSLDCVERAYKTLIQHGRSVQMRIAHHEEMTFDDAKIISYVHQFADRKIAFQDIGPVGRGQELVHFKQVLENRRDKSPCPSTGLLIDNDGVGAPCCASISHADRNNPMFIGNAFTDSLVEMVSRWRIHPLIQTIRVWGFEILSEWLRELNLDPKQYYRHQTCEECVAMLGNSEIAFALNAKANQLDHRISLAVALQRDLQENWLDLQLREEAKSYLLGNHSVWTTASKVNYAVFN